MWDYIILRKRQYRFITSYKILEGVSTQTETYTAHILEDN